MSNSGKIHEVLDRLKKDIKQRAGMASKKNLEVTKSQCENVLEQCINQTIKVKLNQEQYQTYTAFKQDFDALKV